MAPVVSGGARSPGRSGEGRPGGVVAGAAGRE